MSTPRYWAFLSYSHADEAAATKLHRALEHYTLPASVRKAHGLPKRLIPVFRDVEELEAAAGLSKRLESALDESRWLIVLCSPKSAQSKYVNAEIEYFLKRHGPDKILCVLLGEPPEVFPPAIRALPDEPLAADLRASADPEIALLKLVSAMAVIGFTELRNREAQRRKRQRLLAAAAVAGICLGTLAYWDLFHREHVDYYVNYVRREGIWQGVDRLSPDIARRRTENYRFVRHGRLSPPARVEYVNGMGRCAHNGMEALLGGRLELADPLAQPGSRYCAVRFDYHQGGTIAREVWLNMHERPLETIAYTEPGLAQFTQQGFSSAASRSGVQYVQFVRDASGRDTTISFLLSRGIPRPNDAMHFGYRIEYDEAGRVVRKAVLDDAGRDTGEVEVRHYSPQGYLLGERYEDSAGRARAGKQGYAGWRGETDARGNWVLNALHDENDRPVLGSDGYASKRARWDDRGNAIEFSYFGVDGSPVVNRFGYAIERIRPDEAGNPVRWEWLDASGQLVMINGGFAAIEGRFDGRGQPLETRYLNPSGEPVNGVAGAIVRNVYDDLGRELEECFFSPDGSPFLSRWGHCIQRRFDERDDIVEFLFLDGDRKPFGRTDRGGAGVARTVIHRAAGGRITGGEHYDARLKPVIGGNCGCAIFENRLGENGAIVERLRFDADRRLIKGSDGAAIHRLKYDRSGNLVEETYYDEDQKPVRHRDGYYGFTADYDSRGRRVAIHYLGMRREPMPLPATRIHGIRYEHEPLGVSLETYLDADGGVLGSMRFQRDRYGHVLEQRYTDASGRAGADPRTGCALRRFEGYGVWGWDDPSAEHCLDDRGHPVNRKDKGWATRSARLEQGLLKEEFLDAAGRPVKPKAP